MQIVTKAQQLNLISSFDYCLSKMEVETFFYSNTRAIRLLTFLPAYTIII